MQYSILALTAMASAANAATIFVDNHCSFDLWLTSAFGSNPDDGTHQLVANTINTFNAPVTDDAGSQHALTISKTPDMASPLQNVYNVSPDRSIIYYSISTIYGDPLKAEGFRLDSLGNGYDINSPPGRQGDLPGTYSPSNPDGTNAVFTESDNGDFVLSFCG